MSLLPFLPIEAPEGVAELILPIWVFPVIAAAIFLILGLVTWSYRDVYHRHNGRGSDGAASSQDSQH